MPSTRKEAETVLFVYVSISTEHYDTFMTLHYFGAIEFLARSR